MSQNNMAATINELKAACPGADANFLKTQVDQGATVEAAQRAWIAEQNKRARDEALLRHCPEDRLERIDWSRYRYYRR